MESFGQWIKDRRRALKLGRDRCAGRALIRGEALRLIENGISKPTRCMVGTLYGLAQVLDLNPVEVIERAVKEDQGLIERLEMAKKVI